MNDEFGTSSSSFLHYYYYISTKNSAVIIIVVIIFYLNISECMIMIYIEIDGSVTVFKVLWV